MKCYWFIFLSFIISVHCTYTCGSNCLTCDSKNGKCDTCQKGFYKYKLSQNCVETCPDDLLADNFSLSWKEIRENPIYIKAYTFSRCINSCGLVFEDCSCKSDCRKNGTCCSDYKFCEIITENKKESEVNSKCQLTTPNGATCIQCKPKFYFYNNECYDTCPKDTNAFEANKICLKSSSII